VSKTPTARLLMQLAAVALSAQVSLAQVSPPAPRADSPILARNPAGPAELAQYEFLAGDWDVTVTLQRAGGQSVVYQAAWHNHWVANGLVMMQEWREPGSTGIELRSFNPVTRKWDGRNLYVPTPGTWYENQAEFVGGEMIVTTHTQAANGVAEIKREIYHAIATDRFEIRTTVSRDGGASWTPGGYSLVATRIKSSGSEMTSPVMVATAAAKPRARQGRTFVP
jgi:hypothetical protein